MLCPSRISLLLYQAPLPIRPPVPPRLDRHGFNVCICSWWSPPWGERKDAAGQSGLLRKPLYHNLCHENSLKTRMARQFCRTGPKLYKMSYVLVFTEKLFLIVFMVSTFLSTLRRASRRVFFRQYLLISNIYEFGHEKCLDESQSYRKNPSCFSGLNPCVGGSAVFIFWKPQIHKHSKLPVRYPFFFSVVARHATGPRKIPDRKIQLTQPF